MKRMSWLCDSLAYSRLGPSWLSRFAALERDGGMDGGTFIAVWEYGRSGNELIRGMESGDQSVSPSAAKSVSLAAQKDFHSREGGTAGVQIKATRKSADPVCMCFFDRHNFFPCFRALEGFFSFFFCRSSCFSSYRHTVPSPLLSCSFSPAPSLLSSAFLPLILTYLRLIVLDLPLHQQTQHNILHHDRPDGHPDPSIHQGGQ